MIKKIFNNKKYITIISILGLILVLGGVYALVNWQSNDYNIAIKSTCMNINYTKGQDISGNLSVIDETTYVSNNTITMNSGMLFSSVRIGIDNACSDIKGLATIEINVATLSNELKLNGKDYAALKYVVAEYDPTDYTDLDTEVIGDTLTIVSKGNIINTGIIDAHTQYLEPGQVKNYLVIFYVDNKLFANDLQLLSFSGTIDSRAEQFVPTPITDFTYSTSGNNVTITKYNGSAQKVNVAPTYTINGTTYNTVVNGGVFNGKTTVGEVNFASGVTASNGYAYRMFYGCTGLTKISGLPSNITNLNEAFYNCTSLVNAPVVPSTVTSMNSTFRGCTNLINGPVIGNSVSDMQYAFYGCTRLVDAPDVSNSITSLYYTFYNCTSLVSAPSLGNSIQSMFYAFCGCSKLENVSAIPNSVTDMQYTFQNCTSLVNAPTLGSGVQNVSYAFSGCSKLENVGSIPNSVTNMTRTFYGCTSLTGTVRINSSSVTRTSGATYHPFYGTSSSNAITVEVPSGSTTHTNINNNKPSNVNISTFTS